MGRIKELIQSRDGQVRSAKILLPNNKVIGRPINLLFPIECPTTDGAEETTRGNDSVNTNEQNDVKTDLVKPKRDAAIVEGHLKLSGRSVAKTSRIVYICHASLIYVHVSINSMQFFCN